MVLHYSHVKEEGTSANFTEEEIEARTVKYVTRGHTVREERNQVWAAASAEGRPASEARRGHTTHRFSASFDPGTQCNTFTRLFHLILETTLGAVPSS